MSSEVVSASMWGETQEKGSVPASACHRFWGGGIRVCKGAVNTESPESGEIAKIGYVPLRYNT